MEQKSKSISLTRLIIAAIGIAVGFISLAFGIVTVVWYKFDPYYVRSSITFGADYYTESYKAIAAAANNAADLTENVNLLINAVGYILIIAGLVLLLTFLCKLVVSSIELASGSNNSGIKNEVRLCNNIQGVNQYEKQI